MAFVSGIQTKPEQTGSLRSVRIFLYSLVKLSSNSDWTSSHKRTKNKQQTEYQLQPSPLQHGSASHEDAPRSATLGEAEPCFREDVSIVSCNNRKARLPSNLIKLQRKYSSSIKCSSNTMLHDCYLSRCRSGDERYFTMRRLIFDITTSTLYCEEVI